MRAAIVTGAGGLVGSQSVESLVEVGYRVVGLENDMRARLFGHAASTTPMIDRLASRFEDFLALKVDIRDEAAIDRAFADVAGQLELVIHAAAQPSHDWAATDPAADFTINANGTLVLLEATRSHAPGATFIHLSTNKVYGDRPNLLPLEEHPTRLDLPDDHPYFQGVDTSMSIDGSTHSLFGVSKAAADLMVQEYGRYFDMPTGCFRSGCITGPNHAGARLHGFLSYLMKCTVAGEGYTVYGYGGKQVRDIIHSADLVDAFLHFHADPKAGAVYNIGGGRNSNCSLLEAIDACERIVGRRLNSKLVERPRVGDHRWWISDLTAFAADYPRWAPKYDIDRILEELYASNVEVRSVRA
jgi:CDP-paratose 2-epimerase